MKRLIIILLCIFSTFNAFADEYDAVRIYEKQYVEYGVKAVDNLDEVREIQYLLVPAEVEDGSYSVNLTRIGNNLYQIDGTNLLIETQFCYEYCFGEEAVLIVRNYNGITIGKIVFVE